MIDESAGSPRDKSLPETTKTIRIGISSCLMGEPVRFDGSHKRDRFLTESLDKYVDWVPVCPEVGAGMSVPRPTLRLIGDPTKPRLVNGGSGQDWTERVTQYAQETMERLNSLDLCGYVLKSRSPTCGMERVRVYGTTGIPQKVGVGIFARVLMERFPLLPVEEEGRLRDPFLREAFLEAIFAYARWRRFTKEHAEVRDLIAFHRCNKYLLRVHSRSHATQLGRLVASAGRRDVDRTAIKLQYGAMFMKAVRVRATHKQHTYTLRHIASHLRPHISVGANRFLHEVISEYRAGLVPREVPMTLVRHHAREHQLSYLNEQSYLDPFPKPLAVR